MSSIRVMRRRLRDVAIPAIGFALTLYFGYHTVQGNHGWLARQDLREEVTEAEATLDTLRAEREALEERVALMQSETLDPDMLDERIRAMLNYVGPNERVIYLDRNGSGPR